jgi:hypothetical protein
MTEEATSQEDWGMGFASVTMGATKEADWTTRFSLVIEGVSVRVRNEGSWLVALFLGIRGVVETRSSLDKGIHS